MTTCPNALTNLIKEEINAEGGQISFARYMELALYHPEYGYYNSPSFALGKEGDFTTAPEISPLFAKCFARQCVQILEALDTGDILELGAGSGRFAVELLLELQHLNCLPTHYYIYEISLPLREKQKTLLQTTCPELSKKVIWLDALPADFQGVVIANEVLDALPVNCFQADSNGVKERCVGLENDELTWKLCAPSSQELAELTQKIVTEHELTNGYQSEINLWLAPFVQSIANSLTKGVILFADYGYGQREYYHPERHHGTLTCFYQHMHHNNPLIHPGQQDITAHVDFTRVIEEAFEHDCLLAGYTTQAAFLLACGIINITADAEKNMSEIEIFNLHHAIKVLTLPTEMGERIKIMALSKNMTLSLLGFSMQDRRRDL